MTLVWARLPRTLSWWPGTCPELGRVRSQWQCSSAPVCPRMTEFIATKPGRTVDATRTHPTQILVYTFVPPRLLSLLHSNQNGRQLDMILRPFLALAAAALAPLSLASEKVNDVKEVHLRQLNDDNFDSSVAKGAW